MKAILTISKKPRLNAAFKTVQPLPVLPKDLSVDLRLTAAPRFDSMPQAPTAVQQSAPVAAHAVNAADQGAGLSGRLAATTALDGIARCCVTLPDLPAHGQFSRGLEARLVA